MTVRPLSRAEVREVDRRAVAELGMHSLVLMENAGRGCVDMLLAFGCRGPVAIVCGRGNNAGDGFVMARHLDLRGIRARLLLVGDPGLLKGDAAVNHAIVARSGLPMADFWQAFDADCFDYELSHCEWVVDALLGTGSSGPPRPPFDQAIERINAAASMRLAVDLPSGLDCDSGLAAQPTVRADHTCTFVAEKSGFRNPAAALYLGQVHVVDIGVPRCLVEEIAGSTC